MVGYAGFSCEELFKSPETFKAEALEIAIYLIVTKGDGEGVDLFFFKGGTGELVDKLKLLLGGKFVVIQWCLLLSLKESAESVPDSNRFLQAR